MPSTQSVLNQIQIDESIYRSGDINGMTIKTPYIYKMGGCEQWVTDVRFSGRTQILKHVAIAQYAFELLHAEKNIPVRLQRDSAGLYQIIGRAQSQVGNNKIGVGNIEKEGLLFCFGFGLALNGNIVTASEIKRTSSAIQADPSSPPLVIGDPSEIPGEQNKEEGWTFHQLTLGELSPLGSNVLRATIITPVE